MLAPWLELDGVAEQLASYSELAKLDLARLGTTADADEIQNSAVTQPLIVAAGLLAAGQLRFSGAVLAGHSVGEVTAAALAGVLTPTEAVSFAARRGAEMALACAETPTSMVAVLGGDEQDVIAAVIQAGLTPANRNGAGQIVAAGHADNIAKLMEHPPTGARVRPLKVAGAFHTEYMRSAEQTLRGVAAELTPANPHEILLSNADGAGVTDGRTVLARLVAQVTRPVRWDLCLSTMRALGVRAAIELPPSKALTGIAKRELPGVELLAMRGPDDLAKAQELIDRELASTPGADGTVVLTPGNGIFTRAHGLDEGLPVSGGTRIGTIRTDRDELAIVAPATGVLTEWLRANGDIVGAGLPVARVAARPVAEPSAPSTAGESELSVVGMSATSARIEG